MPEMVIFEFSTVAQLFYFSTVSTGLSTVFLDNQGFLSILNVNNYTFLSNKIDFF